MNREFSSKVDADPALRPGEAQFQAVFEGAAIGIALVDATGRPVKSNRAMQEILGYTEAELATMKFTEFTHPEDIRADLELYQSVVSGLRDHYQIEKRYIRKDGQVVWGRLTISPFHSRDLMKRLVIGMVENITARKTAEAALRESEESLRATIENTPNVAVQWYDDQGRVIFWNRASENIFGWTAAEAHGKTRDQLILDSGESARFMKDLLEIARTGKPVPPTEFTFHRRDKSMGFCVSTLFRIPCAGSHCFVCMDVDISPRKKAEQSLREIQERELRSREHFTRALIDAEEQERERLAAELHDSLGQNLSIINNNAYLASLHPGLPPAVAENLKAISRATAETIAEVRQLVLNLRPLQIEQLGLTDSIRELVDKIARTGSMSLDYRVEDIDDSLEGNSATHLYRIVQEALNNLLKHSGARHATFKIERDIHTVRLRIQDDGRGFDVERALAGCGFGLKSISERAQMLNGNLRLNSSPGAGTELIVEFPVVERHRK